MLNAVIIDDEYYFRESLKRAIPWEEMGVAISGEANNGEDALELIRSSKPDVAFVDINMPIINGLELIERTRDSGLETEIVIISGYSDFEFAQKAIRHGVINYLLKPVVKHELRACVRTLTDRINIKREDSKRVDQIVQSRRIRNLLNAPSTEYLPEQLRNSESFQVIAMDISLESMESERQNNRESLAVELKERLDQISNETIRTQAAFDSNGYLIAIVANPPDKNPVGSQYLKHCISMLASLIRDEYGFPVWSGIGRVYRGHEKLVDSYHEALVTLKKLKIHESSGVADYNDDVGPLLNYNLFGQDSKRALFRDMRINNSREIKRRLDELFGWLHDNRAPQQLIKAHAFDITLAVAEFCSREKALEHRIAEIDELFKEIEGTVAIRRMKEMLRDTLLSLAAEFDNQSSERDNIIYNTKAYILENVFDPGFGIQDIADRFRMNYTYLCTLFKDKTGQTLNGFISDIRLARARELLKETDNSISSIAYLCGYNDQYYFSRVFKKHFGVPPSRMR